MRPPLASGAILSMNIAYRQGVFLYFKSKHNYYRPMNSTVSSKGQITIPVEVRRKLGLEPGTRIEFELRKDGALLRKGGHDVHPADQVFRLIELTRPVDAILSDMRDEVPDEDGG